MKRVEDILRVLRDARALMVLERSLPASVKRGLHAPMFNGTADCGFDKVTECLVFGEYGVELSAQLRFDTDLSNDSGIHG